MHCCDPLFASGGLTKHTVSVLLLSPHWTWAKLPFWKSLANFTLHFRYVECWYFLQAFCVSASRGNFVTRLHEYVNVYESFYISADISLHTPMYGHHGFPCMLIRQCVYGHLWFYNVYGQGTSSQQSCADPSLEVFLQSCSWHCNNMDDALKYCLQRSIEQNAQLNYWGIVGRRCCE